jgi:hypothetical protein
MLDTFDEYGHYGGWGGDSGYAIEHKVYCFLFEQELINENIKNRLKTMGENMGRIFM